MYNYNYNFNYNFNYTYILWSLYIFLNVIHCFNNSLIN
jgi:hypothetical protein